MTTHQAKLIKFIEAHDVGPKPEAVGATKLSVKSWVGFQGNWTLERQIIDATPAAVRAWLGY